MPTYISRASPLVLITDTTMQEQLPSPGTSNVWHSLSDAVEVVTEVICTGTQHHHEVTCAETQHHHA